MHGREATAAAPRTPSAARAGAVVLIAAIAVLSFNLRPALVAVGPLAKQIRGDTGLSSAATSLLTTLPLICFGVFSTLAPPLGRRLGLERAIASALGLLIAGVAVRAIPSNVALFGGSALAGAGIALENVLLPGLIKRDFAGHTGPMMGLYSVGLNGGAALAAALTVPLGKTLHTGWRPTLALWGLFAVVALAAWLPSSLRAHASGSTRVAKTDVPVWRSSLAWSVAMFMGFQALLFYGLVAWVPSLLEDHGMGSSEAGLMLALFAFTGIATSFLVPIQAARRRTQRGLVVMTAALFLTGLIGLLAAPAGGAVAWMIVLGFAQGAGISLALTLIVLRCRTAPAAAELSGMAQTVGYLVAALGPLIVGVLHGISGGWTVPLIVLVAMVAGLVTAGISAAGERYLEDETAQPATAR
jgi:MFS transporter, CP family, cyanate transporter